MFSFPDITHNITQYMDVRSILNLLCVVRDKHTLSILHNLTVGFYINLDKGHICVISDSSHKNDVSLCMSLGNILSLLHTELYLFRMDKLPNVFYAGMPNQMRVTYTMKSGMHIKMNLVVVDGCNRLPVPLYIDMRGKDMYPRHSITKTIALNDISHIAPYVYCLSTGVVVGSGDILYSSDMKGFEIAM